MTTVESLTAAPGNLESHIGGKLPSTESSRFAPLVAQLTGELDVAPARPVFLVSAPGRTELAGNHTDHNHGRVLAASVHLDTVAAVAPRDDLTVTLASEGYPVVRIDLSDLAPREEERESTAALIRGVAAALHESGRKIGGFDAAVSSNVAAGSGLSSSASVEVLLGTIMDHAWNSDEIGPTLVAIAGQIAENQYFGKPSGLMDQVACATGGVVTIDFKNNADPLIESLDVSFAEAGLSLLVVDTGANHADLTHEYAAIPAEMIAVAQKLGGAVLAESDETTLLGKLSELRSNLGDRAVARALHFYAENQRVCEMVEALRDQNFERYIQFMADSGRSSGMYLQNCAPASVSDEQAVVIALALTERYLATAGLRFGRDAACRVHGGGFAGTIQVLLPSDRVQGYCDFVQPLLGSNAVTELEIRATGAVAW